MRRNLKNHPRIGRSRLGAAPSRGFGRVVVLQGPSAYVVAMVLAVVAGLLTVGLPIQISIFMLCLIVAFILQSRGRIVLFATFFIPFSGLIRRVVAGPSGYTESDPLVLLPLALVALSVVLSLGHAPGSSYRKWPVALAAVAGFSILGTVALRLSFSVPAIFFAACLAVPLLLAAALASGRMPSIWSSIERSVPLLAVAAGVYGVIQFFILPSWDRSWMITSDLKSIGAPFPLQVRVFGASESPGPYAMYIGLAVVLLLAMAVAGSKLAPVWLAIAACLSVPLILSGVRTALLAIAICAVALVLLRGRGWTRILPAVLLVGIYTVLNSVLSRFAGQSSILTADRYTNFDSETDGSLTARLDLVRYLRNPFQYLVGTPSAPAIDNLYIDVLVRYGLLPAIAIVLLVIWVVIMSIRNLATSRNEVASACAIFIAVASMSGNVFNTQFGILVGIVFGTVMLTPVTGGRHRDALSVGASPTLGALIPLRQR